MYKKIGILAGNGDLVNQVVLACEEAKRPFFILAFEGQTDPALLKNRDHQWVSVGKIGKALQFLREAHVEELVLVGHFKRPAWSELRPDLTGAKWMAQLTAKALGDDGLLKVIVENLEKEGFPVMSPEALLNKNQFLMPADILSQAKPDPLADKDIQRGIDVLMSLKDVGQSIIVQQGLILGIEAIEGTDALIERCKAYHKPGAGGVLVKILKPRQETRVDRPTIGPKTFEKAAACKLRGIAVQADQVIVLDQARCIQIADAHGLFFIGLTL